MIRNPFKRGVSVPDEVVAAAALRPGEKVLAGTRTTDGRWLLGTRDALHVVGTPGAEPGPVVEPVETRPVVEPVETRPGAEPGPVVEPVETRIPWEQIERADWDGDAQRLVVVEVGEFGRVQPRHEFPVAEPGLLLELVRERVTASVVLQRRVAVHGKRGLLVIGRRAPGGDGAVSWAYQFDAGVDPEDPAVLAAAEAGLRAAEADLGM